MSLIKANSAQIGQSNTATQNFTLTTGLDGTAKLARGNAGATTQDILTVDAAGNINAPVSIQKAGSVLQALSDFSGSNVSLAASGYQKLPSGLIIQWGNVTAASYNAANTFQSTDFSWVVAFPNAILSASAAIKAGISNNTYVNMSLENRTVNGARFVYSSGSAPVMPQFSYIAVGY